MTEQLKAEAYVYQKRPALVKHYETSGSCTRKELPINLQDWLAVLGYTPKSIIDRHDTMSISKYGRWVFFDLTTGQPRTEADYKAFNDIVSV
jgi:hypothetical protein